MRSRSLIAFLAGAVLFAVAPYFDSEIPGGETFLIVLLGLGGGAAIVLIAGRWRAWWLAPTCALIGAIVGQIYYEVALEPPPQNGFEVDSVAFSALYTFLFSGPAAAVGALLAALALAAHVRRRQRID